MSQPRIKKIDIIDGDTLVLTEYYQYIPYKNTFKYSDGKFEKFMMDSSEVIDFNKYGEKSYFIKKISNNKFEVINGSKSITLKLKSTPYLVDISYIPAVISSNKIYILNFNTSKFEYYKIPSMIKWRGSILCDMGDKNNFFGTDFSYTVFFENHLFMPLFHDFNYSALFDFNLKKNSCKEYSIISLHSAVLNDDTLIFLKGNMYPWIRAGLVKIYKKDDNNLHLKETEDKNYDFRGKNQVLLSENLAVDKNSNNIVYLTDFGFCLTKNDKVLNMRAFDFTFKTTGITYNDFPRYLFITGKKLFVGSYHSGLYIFDYPSLKFEKRIIFSRENLISIDLIHTFSFLDDMKMYF
jgi:hypothetical protein